VVARYRTHGLISSNLMRLALTIAITAGCERLAGLDKPTDVAPAPEPSAGAGGLSGGASGGSSLMPVAGQGGDPLMPVAGQGGDLGSPMPDPDPASTCTIDVSDIDDCNLD
jgi:hypothetical protein